MFMEGDHQGKHICKFCYKSFPSGRSLGGHMRSHMVNVSSDDHHQKLRGKLKLPKKKLPPLLITSTDAKTGVFWTSKENPNKTKKRNEADSWNSCDDSQSVCEAATPSIKRKRSDRKKRYKANQYYTSSSSISEIDQQEQEEVALSLIMLSRESGRWGGVIDTVIESTNNSHELVEAKGVAVKLKPHRFKRINGRGLNPSVDFSKDYNLDKFDDLHGSEVDSPRKVTRKAESLPHDPRRHELSQDSDVKSRFECTVCRKVFRSYQALGGHRASHKKYKGCCYPTNSGTLEAETSPNPSFEESKLIKCNSSQSLTGGFTKSPSNEVLSKREKEHECPVCFKTFPSGQALGGHKRSHLTGVQSNKFSSTVNDEPTKETRHFLDLNMPAPAEDEEFKLAVTTIKIY